MNFLSEVLSSKDVIQEWHPHVYEIEHKRTGMIYVGCVYARGKWYLERFREHILGKTASFQALYALHLAKQDDEFICRLITFVHDHDRACEVEQHFISKVPIARSINHIVGCHFDTRVTRVRRFDELSNLGYCMKLFLTDTREITDLQRLIDLKVSSRTDLAKLHKSYETALGIASSPTWRAGRTKLAQRKRAGKLTEAEKAAYAELPAKIAQDWQGRSSEYVTQRTSSGLSVMNSKLTCHCGVSVSRGNYARYHGDKCKLKQ